MNTSPARTSVRSASSTSYSKKIVRAAEPISLRACPVEVTRVNNYLFGQALTTINIDHDSQPAEIPCPASLTSSFSHFTPPVSTAFVVMTAISTIPSHRFLHRPYPAPSYGGLGIVRLISILGAKEGSARRVKCRLLIWNEMFVLVNP